MRIDQGIIRPDDAVSEGRSDRLPPPFEPLFLGDWVDAVFIHYEVDAKVLQTEVPFELDLWEGRAFVSLVAFTMRRLRPRSGGRLAEALFKPLACTGYLNVRTYTRHRTEPGIYFIAEFVSNPLCVPLGRPSFGLPYRSGHLVYQHDHAGGGIEGAVRAAGERGRLAYRGRLASSAGFHSCRPGTLDAFLLERYTAFTGAGNKRRLFHVWHPPWLQASLEIVVEDEGLLATTGGWASHAHLVGANFSPGVHDVGMGWPRRIRWPGPRRRLTVFFDD